MSRAEHPPDYSRISLRSILIFSLISQITLAVGLTGYLSWRNGQKTVENLAMSLSREITAHTKSRMDNFFNIPTLFLQINQSFIQLDNLDVDNFSNLKNNFWLQAQLTPQVNTIYYGNEAGNFLQIEMQDSPKISVRNSLTAPNWEIYNLNDQGEKTTLISTAQYDPRLRPWYKAAIEAKKIAWSPVYLFSDPPVLGITPVMPIFNRQTGNPKGVMAIDLTLQEISDFLSNLEISPAGKALIVEESGGIVAISTQDNTVTNSLNQEQRLTYLKIQDELISSTMALLMKEITNFANIETEQQYIFKVGNKRNFVQVSPLVKRPGLNWLTIVIIPESDFMEHIHKNTYVSLILCAIALLLATLLGAISNRWIFKSITRLTSASQAISQGEFNQIAELPKIKELAIVALSVNSLAQQVQNSQDSSLWAEQRVEEKTKQLQLANQELQQLVIIDSLTGIFNRYYFDITLNQLWWENLVDKKPIALILCDIDYFKAYNDNYGHVKGDSCLRQVAQTLSDILQRNDDFLARYGGEEFVVILPNTSELDAIEIANKIRIGIQQQQIPHAASEIDDCITISCGVTATVPRDNLTSAKLIEQADVALYEAKKQGRNRIVFCDRA